MIRKLAWVLLAVALGAAAAYYLRDRTGYVMATWGPWVLEASALGFIFTIVAALFLLYLVAVALRFLFRLPETVRDALGARRQAQAQASFEGGVQKLIEGQWATAEAELVRRAADHEASGLNYLLAARAAQRAGAPDRRERYLELAAGRGEDAALTSALVRAQLQLERGEYVPAIPALESLQARLPGNAHVTELLAQAYSKSGQWDALRRLLAAAEGARALPPERHRDLYGRALEAGLAAAGKAARLEDLKALWQSTPSDVKAQARVRAAYLRGLARVGADREAAAQIVAMLGHGWDPALAAIYGELDGLEATDQLATIESWLTQQGEKPELLLAAGRTCLRNQLWGKARAYLEGALKLAPSASVFLALARLAELTRNPEEAALNYRRGLEFAAARAEPDDRQPSAGQVSKA